MKPPHLLVVSLVFAVAVSGRLQAQPPLASSQGDNAPLLTLEDAVSLALSNNRLVKNSALEAQKFDSRVGTARSLRLPHFQFSVLGGELLNSVDFTFPRGAFGTYPSTGPIPETEAKIHTPRRFATYITGALAEPLTQQYKIGLGIRATELGRHVAREDVRAERQKIAAEVRSAYFDLVATQAGLEAVRQTVAALEEAQRVTVRYRAQETVLKADALEVDARLAKGRYDLAVAENGLATQREDLNQLLGRGLDTPFRVSPIPQEELTGLTLAGARERAAQNRPELRQAHLKEQQAETDRRIAKAQYIPDVSAYVGYVGIENVEVLPTDVGVAGFLFTWEPFDWGRRHNAVVEKSEAVEQARNAAQEAEAQIAVEVGMTYRAWEEAALLLKAARTEREAAAEQFRATSNQYKQQAALIKDLLQAQARSAETEFQYQQALSSYGSALANLRRAMGEE
jgi:outer membrane protein TolC